MRVFVPGDAAAVAVGADDVARRSGTAAQRHGVAVEIVRNGSRGMFWLEPMVEVETPAGRIAYGPVDRADVRRLFEAGFLGGGNHPLRIGRPEEHPFLKRQTRLAFARCGITDPLSLDDYRAHGGLMGLERAIAHGSGGNRRGSHYLRPSRARAVQASRPASNGGRSRDTKAAQKYIVCNADEGDSGTFSDRMMMEGDPVLPDRGHGDCRHGDGRHQGLHLYPLGISARHRGNAGSRESARAAMGCSARRCSARLRLRYDGARWCRRLCLRRGDGAARQPRRQARAGEGEAAAAGASLGCSASRPS